MKTIDTDNEYDAQAEMFLAAAGLTFKVEATADNKCPRWCEDGEHTHGKEYRVSLKRTHGRTFSLRFWNSANDVARGLSPRAYDVLTCITKSDPGTFDDFCADLGYSTDSRKAFGTYKAVVKEWETVSRFFTPAELKALQEIN